MSKKSLKKGTASTNPSNRPVRDNAETVQPRKVPVARKNSKNT